MHDDGQCGLRLCREESEREQKMSTVSLSSIQIYRIAIEMHTTKIQTTDIRLERLVHLMPHHIEYALNIFSSACISEKVF